MCIETVVEGYNSGLRFEFLPFVPSLTDQGLDFVQASIVFAVAPAKNKYLSFHRMEEMVSFLGNTVRDTFEVVVPKRQINVEIEFTGG